MTNGTDRGRNARKTRLRLAEKNLETAKEWQVKEADLGTFAPTSACLPRPIVAAARQGFWLRSHDVQLADLMTDRTEIAGNQAAWPSLHRYLDFQCTGSGVELDVMVRRRVREVTGRLRPPTAEEVEVRRPWGSVLVKTDCGGQFAMGGLAPGPLSLRWRLRGRDLVIETEWVAV